MTDGEGLLGKTGEQLLVVYSSIGLAKVYSVYTYVVYMF
jgi:hypothetical protein